MGIQLEEAKARLKAAGIKNIKFFPGSNRDATPEQMAEEINRTLTRLEEGDFELPDQDQE